MRDYTKLTVWQKSHELALRIYRTSAKFPTTETYGLVTQMRRAAASIPSNIAEGAGRRTQADYRRFIDIAAGSASELDYQIRLVRDLGYLPDEDAERLGCSTSEVKNMLRAFGNTLAKS